MSGHRFTLLESFPSGTPPLPLRERGGVRGNKRGIRKVGFLDENETLYI